MSRSAKLENIFVGEGYYTLRLGIGELISLQELTGIGPAVLANRFANNEWRITDVTQTVRLGLIGGGMSQKEAFDLCERVIQPGYLMDYAAIGHSAILAALVGVEDEVLDQGEALAPTMEETIPAD